MTALYPLKFKPIYKDKIWGGQKIKTVLNKDFEPLPNCGELWALSGIEGEESEVLNGFLAGNNLNELLEIYMYELVGDRVYETYGNEFPVLIKFLNASDYLSVQVHPDDDTARRKHGCAGKTEMWYIIDSAPESELIIGLKEGINNESFTEYLQKGRIAETLNRVKVAPGDAFYIPAGRVHAIGKGILLAEIQQTSDITYRLYDWDRRDAKGNSRELHVDDALEAIDFKTIENIYTPYARLNDLPTAMVASPYFTVNHLSLTKPQLFDLVSRDSFTAFVCTQGLADIHTESDKISIEAGECVLIPAELNDFFIAPMPTAHLLEVFLP